MTQTQSAGKGQALYHGFTKPREAHHDADLYRLYQKAAAKIEGQGGRNLRVVLDYELKKHLYRDLAKFGEDRNSASGKHAIAERHGLQRRARKDSRPGRSDRIRNPRWRTRSRGPRTRHRSLPLRNLAEKVLAGFSIYAHADEASKLRRILDQRELTAEILSL